MPLVAFLPALIGAGGALGGALIAKSAAGKGSSTPEISPQQQQLIDLQKNFASYGFPQAQANFAKAGGAYDTSLDFYHSILHGSDDDLMKLINAKEYTKSADESQATTYNLGARGGARAAVLGQTSEDRAGLLQGILSNLRLNAPGQIANIGQAFANMGATQAGAATGTSQGASNILFQQQELAQQAADRRANLIASIIGTAGTALGAYFGNKGGG